MLFVALLLFTLNLTETTRPICTPGIGEEHLNRNENEEIVPVPLLTTLRGTITLEVIPRDINFSVYFLMINRTQGPDSEIALEDYDPLLILYTDPSHLVISYKEGATMLYLDPSQRVPTVARIEISYRLYYIVNS